MDTKLEHFLQTFVEKIKNHITHVVEFGSFKGEHDLTMSDVDLLVIVRDQIPFQQIVHEAHRLEENLLHIHHSAIAERLQQLIFASQEYNGIHLLMVRRNELDEHWQPCSFRLKLIMNTFISKSIFLYAIKHHHRILYGEDSSKDIVVPKPGIQDRLAIRWFPFVLLMLTLFNIRHRTDFVVWCCKSVRYRESMEKIYCILTGKPYQSLATIKFHQYRYNPTAYTGSRLSLWLSALLIILACPMVPDKRIVR